MCTARLFFRGSNSLHSNFTWTGSSSINHSWRQKTRDTGLPDGEDRIRLCSVVLTQYWSVTDRRQTDERRDGQTDNRHDMPQHIERLRRAVKTVKNLVRISFHGTLLKRPTGQCLGNVCLSQKIKCLLHFGAYMEHHRYVFRCAFIIFNSHMFLLRILYLSLIHI